jgi:hypothetical protein
MNLKSEFLPADLPLSRSKKAWGGEHGAKSPMIEGRPLSAMIHELRSVSKEAVEGGKDEA